MMLGDFAYAMESARVSVLYSKIRRISALARGLSPLSHGCGPVCYSVLPKDHLGRQQTPF